MFLSCIRCHEYWAFCSNTRKHTLQGSIAFLSGSVSTGDHFGHKIQPCTCGVSSDRWVAKHAHRLQGHLLHLKQFNVTTGVHIQTDAKQAVKKSSYEIRGGGKKSESQLVLWTLPGTSVITHCTLSEKNTASARLFWTSKGKYALTSSINESTSICKILYGTVAWKIPTLRKWILQQNCSLR